MKQAYQMVDRKDSRALAEFLSREGQLLLPMLELLEQADPSRLRTRMAVDELIDVAGRATPVLERSEGIESGGVTACPGVGPVRAGW